MNQNSIGKLGVGTAAILILLLLCLLALVMQQPRQTGGSGADGPRFGSGEGPRCHGAQGAPAENSGDGRVGASRCESTSPTEGNVTGSQENTAPSQPSWPKNVSIDIEVSVAGIAGASSVAVLTSGRYVKGAELIAASPVIIPAKGGSTKVVCRNILDLRLSGDTLVMAILAVLQPLDQQGQPIPGELLCFGAHTVIEKDELARVQRICVGQTAPTRQVSMMLRSEDAGGSCQLSLININSRAWLSRKDARQHEPQLWPSEAGKEFRIGKEGEEYSEPNDTALVFSALIGGDSRLRVRQLPLGFALPTLVQITQPQHSQAESIVFSNGGGATVVNRQKNRAAILPRGNDTLEYGRTAGELFPQIELTGGLGPEKLDWGKFRVRCHLPQRGNDSREGPELAQALFDNAKGRWTWAITSSFDVTLLTGAKVFFTLEEVGSARVVVEGRLSPKPDITLQVKKPAYPWTITVAFHDSDEVATPLPIDFQYYFGATRGACFGTAWTRTDATWQLTGIDGPESLDALVGDSLVSVTVSAETLTKFLSDILRQKTGQEPSIKLSVIPDHEANKPFSCDFALRTITLTYRFSITIREGAGDPMSLSKFLATHDVRSEYLDGISGLRSPK